jgi:hypothetical protein
LTGARQPNHTAPALSKIDPSDIAQPAQRAMVAPLPTQARRRGWTGSAVVAKVAGLAPGATPKDIPWLKLEVIERRGNGVLIPDKHHPTHQHAGWHDGRRL